MILLFFEWTSRKKFCLKKCQEIIERRAKCRLRRIRFHESLTSSRWQRAYPAETDDKRLLHFCGLYLWRRHVTFPDILWFNPKTRYESYSRDAENTNLNFFLTILYATISSRLLHDNDDIEWESNAENDKFYFLFRGLTICTVLVWLVPDHDGGRPMEVNACILITHMVYL